MFRVSYICVWGCAEDLEMLQLGRVASSFEIFLQSLAVVDEIDVRLVRWRLVGSFGYGIASVLEVLVNNLVVFLGAHLA